MFLLLLAIADDAGGLIILAVFYPQGELAPIWLLLSAAAASGCTLCEPPAARAGRARDGRPWATCPPQALGFWPYVSPGA